MSALDPQPPPDLRLVFIATGEIALPAFRHLLQHGPRPLALVTQPDKPVGRHQTLTPPAIKSVAIAAGIPVLQPERISEATDLLAALAPEILVIMAYGQILRDDILTLPCKAIINLHASLLPRFRGAACIQAAIDAGDTSTGITSIHVVRKLDAGDVILARSLAIAPDETGASLHDRLAHLATEVLADSLTQLADGTATRTPQDDALVSYVPKLGREHGLLDWTQPAAALERRIRAYHPWPGTHAVAIEAGLPKRLKIHPPTSIGTGSLDPGRISIQAGKLIVGCGEGSTLTLTSVQPDGGKPMSAADYLRGRHPEAFRLNPHGP